MEDKQLNGFLITNEINIFYFAGFLGAARLLIPSQGENILYVYRVNYENARETAKNCQVELLKTGENAEEKAAEQITKLRLKRVGFDAFDVSSFSTLKKNLKDVSLKPSGQMVWELRKIKDEIEIGCMKKAAQLTDLGAKALAEIIKPGMREYEVAAEVEYAMRKSGSEGTAFDTIVASGKRSAYPHGGCTTKKIGEGELIQFDVGATYQGYRSDLTRTFLIGKPTSRQEEIYKVVKEAQEKAFQEIRDNARAGEVDAAARDIMSKYGYGQYFVHGLGHGVGLEVHELPTLNSVSKDILKTGNVVTDEPGIYIAGYGGVRIEDTVLVHKNRAERLTKADYKLTV
jgi:Xaa-Pro aminopeptidase